MNVGSATGHFGVTTRITRVGFADGWTGAVAIGVICLHRGCHLRDRRRFPVLASPRFLHAHVGLAGSHSGFAARRRRRAQGVAAGGAPHLEIHCGGARHLHLRQPGRLLPAGTRADAVPVACRLLLPRVLPDTFHWLRGRPSGEFAAGVLGPAAAGRIDPGAGIRHLLLVLRDQPGRGRERGGVRALRADADLHRPRLPDADGDRRPAHERDQLPAAQDDSRLADWRIRPDVPRRTSSGPRPSSPRPTSPGKTSRMSLTSPATPFSPEPPRCRSATSRGRNA